MNIIVIGAGAMGGLFGGLLAESGQDVRLIDVAGPHLSALQRDGLRLQTHGRDRTIRVAAGSAAAFDAPSDLAIVFTKGPFTEAAVRAAAHLVPAGSWVLTVQNGLGNAATIQGVLPQSRLAIGMTSWPADLQGPGHVVSHGDGSVRIWSMDGQDDPAIHAIAGALSRAGLNGLADPSVEVAIWEKVAFNAAMNSIAAVSRLTVGQIADSPAGRALVDGIVAETMAVAAARGLAVEPKRVGGMIEMAFGQHRDHRPSMLQDVLAGRPTEIATINGAIVVAADQLGLATPITRALRDLVLLVEGSVSAGRSSPVLPGLSAASSG